jgi:hypothetical protein
VLSLDLLFFSHRGGGGGGGGGREIHTLHPLDLNPQPILALEIPFPVVHNAGETRAAQDGAIYRPLEQGIGSVR